MGAMGNWSVHSICVSKEEFHIRSQSKGSSAGRCSFHTNFFEVAIKALEQHNIDLLVLPAHSSTILQPLDLTCNGVFKNHLGQHFQPQPNETRDCQRIRLLAIAAMALEIAMCSFHVTSGFARAGICPLNVQAPLNSHLIKNPIDDAVVERPKKRRRGITIAGRLLTAGQPITVSALGATETTTSTTAITYPVVEEPSEEVAAQ
jgi:hypothetical protein